MKVADINSKSVKEISVQELMNMHSRMHMLYAGAIKRGAKKEFINDIKSKHAILVAEMERRGYNHMTPLKRKK